MKQLVTDLYKKYPTLKRFITELDTLPECNSYGPWIAGGSIRTTLENRQLETDVDYFVASTSQVEDLENALVDRGWTKTFSTVNAFTFSHPYRVYKVQIILRKYHNIDDMLENFDITVSQFAWDGSHIHYGKDTFDHFTTKQLVFNVLQNPYGTMKRMIKYVKYGYTPDRQQLVNILRAVKDCVHPIEFIEYKEIKINENK